MHSNIGAAFYLAPVPAGLTLLIALIVGLIKRKFPKGTIIFGLVLLIIPFSFLFRHISSEKKEMRKKQGVYRVLRMENIEKLCSPGSVDGLQLTLHKSGNYSFNFKPCFADSKAGKWKWQDDMVGSNAVFDLRLNTHAYLYFDHNDTLRLIKGGREVSYVCKTGH